MNRKLRKTIITIALTLAIACLISSANAEIWSPDQYKEWRMGSVEYLTSTGTQLYMNSGGELLVYDVSNPSLPIQVAIIPDAARPVASAGQIGQLITTNQKAVAVAKYSEVAIVDKSGWILTTYTPTAKPKAVEFNGNTLYVATADGVEVLDVTDPQNPVKTATIAEPATDIHSDGERIFVMHEKKVTIYAAGTLQRISEYTFSGVIWDVEAGNGYLYLTDYNKVEVIDVRGASPRKTGQFVPVTPVPLYKTIDLVDGYLVVTEHDAWIDILDVSDPTNPHSIAQYNYRPIEVWGGYPNDVTPIGNNHFVLAVAYGGARIVDMSDPSNPKHISEISTAGRVYDVALKDGIVYAVDDSGLLAIDFNQEIPVQLDYHKYYGRSFNIILDDNKAYCAAAQAGVQIYDITNPSNLDPVGQWRSGTYSIGLLKNGNTLYSITNGVISVLDVSNPANPIFIKKVDHGSDHFGYSMVRKGNIMYATNGNLGLRIYDISNARDPRLLSTIMPAGMSNPGPASGTGGIVKLYIEGDNLYVTDYYNGLIVMDISDPRNPASISKLKLPKPLFMGAVKAKDNIVYVCSAYGGTLFRVDVTDRNNPALIDSQSGGCYSLKIEGDDVAVARWDNGVAVYPVVSGSAQTINTTTTTLPTNSTTTTVSTSSTTITTITLPSLGEEMIYSATRGDAHMIDVSDPLDGRGDKVGGLGSYMMIGDYGGTSSGVNDDKYAGLAYFPIEGLCDGGQVSYAFLALKVYVGFGNPPAVDIDHVDLADGRMDPKDYEKSPLTDSIHSFDCKSNHYWFDVKDYVNDDIGSSRKHSTFRLDTKSYIDNDMNDNCYIKTYGEDAVRLLYRCTPTTSTTSSTTTTTLAPTTTTLANATTTTMPPTTTLMNQTTTTLANQTTTTLMNQSTTTTIMNGTTTTLVNGTSTTIPETTSTTSLTTSTTIQSTTTTIMQTTTTSAPTTSTTLKDFGDKKIVSFTRWDAHVSDNTDPLDSTGDLVGGLGSYMMIGDHEGYAGAYDNMYSGFADFNIQGLCDGGIVSNAFLKLNVYHTYGTTPEIEIDHMLNGDGTLDTVDYSKLALSEGFKSFKCNEGDYWFEVTDRLNNDILNYRKYSSYRLRPTTYYDDGKNDNCYITTYWGDAKPTISYTCDPQGTTTSTTSTSTTLAGYWEGSIISTARRDAHVLDSSNPLDFKADIIGGEGYYMFVGDRSGGANDDLYNGYMIFDIAGICDGGTVSESIVEYEVYLGWGTRPEVEVQHIENEDGVVDLEDYAKDPLSGNVHSFTCIDGRYKFESTSQVNADINAGRGITSFVLKPNTYHDNGNHDNCYINTYWDSNKPVLRYRCSSQPAGGASGYYEKLEELTV
ncbi:LVIVD repeat-containing protein [Candidatus Altiarchaeota archaeon]